MTTTSTTRRLFALLLCACVLALPACDSGGDDETSQGDFRLAGRWQSATVDTPNNTTFSTVFNFASESENVNGNALLEFGDQDSNDFDTVPGRVNGTYDYPDIDLLIVTTPAGSEYDVVCEITGDTTMSCDFFAGTDGELSGIRVEKTLE